MIRHRRGDLSFVKRTVTERDEFRAQNSAADINNRRPIGVPNSSLIFETIEHAFHPVGGDDLESEKMFVTAKPHILPSHFLRGAGVI